MSWVAYDTDQVPPITQAEQENNVNIIAAFFRNEGWTDNAIAAMLGNMQVESYLNPCQFELNQNYSMAYGFGLVQWTPATKLSDYVGYNWRTDYDAQLDRIRYEWGNEIQWIPRSVYGSMSFHDFSTSTANVRYLAEVFERCYENPLDWQASVAVRQNYADNWYTYLGGTPTPFSNLPIWLLFKIRWRGK